VSRRNRTTRPRPSRTRRDAFVRRPFEGLVDEPQWVALREFVPAATAPLRLAPALVAEYGPRPVTLATLLPLARPAMTRPDGQVLVGLQRDGRSGDVNRDIAAADVPVPAQPGDRPGLADVLEDGELALTMHEGFEFWLGGGDDPAVTASMERANASIYPTVRMRGARAAYWCQVPGRAHLRWVLSEPEETALPALARVSAGEGMALGDRTRFAGMFRAHGLLVPVWDLPRDAPAEQWEEPLAAFAQRYQDALAVTGALDAAGRRAREGLVSRQVTLR
jgi:hypothetical protein